MVKAAGYDDYYVTSDLAAPEKSLAYARASSNAGLYPHFGFSLETASDALRVLNALPHELLGTMFCGYHWFRVDRTPVRSLLDRMEDRLFGVNLCGSSFVGAGNEINGLDPLIQPLDEGEMNNTDVIGALREFGYAGSVRVQGYGVTAPAQEALVRSREALRRMWSN